MKTLYEKQQEAFDFFIAKQRAGSNTLDTSHVGTGKTIVACHLAKMLNRPVAVICPKAVIPSWQRELAECGIKPLFVLNYEKIRTGKTDYMSKRGKKIMKWHLPEGTLMLVDEVHKCLPHGTLVAMADGSKKQIQRVRVGDKVATPIGPKSVTHRVRSGYKKCLIVKTEKGTIVSSDEHRIYTKKGWVQAKELTTEDSVFVRGVSEASLGSERSQQNVSELLSRVAPSDGDTTMRRVPDSNIQKTEQLYSPSREDDVFFKVPERIVMGVRHTEVQRIRAIQENAAGEPCPVSKTVGSDEITQPNDVRGHQDPRVNQIPRNQLKAWELQEAPSRWERDWVNPTTGESLKPATTRVVGRVHGVAQMEHPRQELAFDASGLSSSRKEVGSGVRWEIPQLPKGTRKGCEEGQAFGGEWLESPPTEEQGRLCGRTSKVLQVTELESELVCYDIEVEDAKCFYAEDILVHNCKGPYTQNAQLLISLVTQGYSVHAMSATAAEDPTEMRPIGFALGLHNLNKPEDGLKSWYGWMMQYGCSQNEWGAWELRRKPKLNDLNKVMYGKNVKRLTVDDFPDSFKANRVFVEPVAFTSASKIAKAYEKLGITPEIIENYLLTGSVDDSEWVLVNLLRARQLAESLKAKDMADMAKDYIEQGNSVVLFVNFSDTAEVLSGLLDCPAIVGGQSAEERQQIIDDFQADKQHVIVVNIAAGGTGISLHDINGNRQRISLISPTFNVKDHLQALGRIHRNGAKSDAIQKILVASDSIEEHVMRVIEEKTSNLNTLHQ